MTVLVIDPLVLLAAEPLPASQAQATYVSVAALNAPEFPTVKPSASKDCKYWPTPAFSASDVFDESDYIRDYNSFIHAVR